MGSRRRHDGYRPRATVLDPIHGSIQLSSLEYALLQTPFLSRLHWVKQLGMVYLVYPQAKHSRLEHSLGVMHLTGRAAEIIAGRWHAELGLASERQARAFVALARLAGLLHDLGHPPFSHAMEEVFYKIAQESGFVTRAMPGLRGVGEAIVEGVRGYSESQGIVRAKVHEVLTYAFTSKLAEMVEDYRARYQVMSEVDERTLIEAVLDVFRVMWSDCRRFKAAGVESLGLPEQTASVIATLISNRVADTDRLDYIPRDGYNTGVVFGAIDHDRILRHLRVSSAEGPDGNVWVRLEVEDKGIPAIEDVYDARFKMYRTVYYHHKNIALTIALALTLAGIIEHWDEVAALAYTKALGGPEGLFNPERLADAIASGAIAFSDSEVDVMMRALAGSGGTAARWARALVWDRRLLPISVIKRPETFIYRVLGDDAGALAAPDLGIIISGALGRKIHEIEDEVSEVVSRRLGLDKPDVEVTVWYKPIADAAGWGRGRTGYCGGSLEVSGARQSVYLNAIARLASTPVIGVYIYSHDEDKHLKIWRAREDLRRHVEDLVTSILSRAVREEASGRPLQRGTEATSSS